MPSVNLLQTGKTMEVKSSVSPQPTQIGNTVLSQYDTIKIQKSYGCKACGGPQFGAGGDIQAASNTTEANCLWWLTTDSNKQIIIDISVHIKLTF